MADLTTNELIKMAQQQVYDEMKEHFNDLGEPGLRYTKEQQKYALQQIPEYGVRATSRILQLPRRTLQRWCRKYDVKVKRCPAWVYEWAERRRRRREFWQRRGYY